MTEDLVRSTSSQRSNPRVIRRVRPVPYESCGGVCSLFNSSCFTMCCNGQKTRRRSSVYLPAALARKHIEEKNDENKKEEEEHEVIETEELEDQISEAPPPKRLIKPDSLDGLTEDELFAFQSRIIIDEDKINDPIASFDVSSYIPQRAESEENLLDEKVEVKEEIAVLTDDTNVPIGDETDKKKKTRKILDVLKIKKTRSKNKDGLSITSSATSLAYSEVSEDLVQSQKEAEGIQVDATDASLPMKQEKDDAKAVTENVKEKGKFFTRNLHSVFSSIRRKKGKKSDDSKDEITPDKVIPLGSDSSAKPDEFPTSDLEVNNRKKPFWRTLSRRDKKDVNKEIVNGVKEDGNKEDAKLNENLEIGADAMKVFGTDTPSEIQNDEKKKKTLFGALSLKKKDDDTLQSDNKKNSQTPCFPLSACVNSNIKPETDQKALTDSVEVKTIADEDPESDNNTIRIIRNEFFLTEIYSGTLRPTAIDTEGDKEVDIDEEDTVEEEIRESDEQIDLDGLEKEKEKSKLEEVVEEFKQNGNEQENTQDQINPCESTNDKNNDISEDNASEEPNSEGSPASAKKYKVFEKEDFSESLHTLVDDTCDNQVLLVPSSAFTDISGVEEEQKGDLPEGTFRTSCELSIEGSGHIDETKVEHSKDDVPEQEKQVVEPEPLVEVQNVEVTAESTIGTGVSSNEVKMTESTDTLKEGESSNTSWIEVANVEDLSESQFNYIYTTTLKAVQDSTTSVVPDEIKTVEDAASEKDDTKLEDNVEENTDEINTVEDAAPEIDDTKVEDNVEKNNELIEKNNCDICGKSVHGDDCKENETTKCVCTTLTKPRQSLTEIEEGSVKSKVDAFNKSKQPIIMPLGAVDFIKKDDVLISEAQSSPTLGSKSKSATPSPIAAKSRSGTLSSTNSDWQTPEEDIDRMIQGRGSLSGLGLRSDSMASVYSGAGEGRYGTVAVRGQVEFGLQYNYKAGALEIHVKQCKDLAPVDTKRNRSDPYVKVYLLPDKSKSGKRKTKVKKHTLNPVFDETLKFHISLNGLETRTLWLTVWHSDMFGRNDFLGEVMMSLENKVFDDPAPVWYNLQERTEPFDDTISFKGDIIVCLKFVPPDMTVQKKGKRSRGTLHVLVKEAKYLTAYKANGTSDPFCKSYLLPDKGRNSKQKTPVVKKTVNPVWNHTFIYEDVTLQELAERCLELTVWDHDRLASNEFLGGVRFSLGTGKHYGKPVEWMDATGKEMTLWKSMLERPNFWVEGCLSLRPSLDARTS